MGKKDIKEAISRGIEQSKENYDEDVNEFSEGQTKLIAKRAMKYGHEIGYGVEELGDMDQKVIDQKFDEWWSANEEE